MNNYLAVNPNQGLRIAKLILADTGTYEEQWRRPFETFIDSNAWGELGSRINPNRAIVPGTISGLTNNIIQPQLQPERSVIIPNGWNMHRFRYCMIVQHIDQFGVETFEMVTGMTDNRGISHGGALDPHMTFYVNSVLFLRSTVTRTPVGNQKLFNVADNSQVLVQNDFAGIRALDRDHRMRPIDLYATMDRTHLSPADMEGSNDTRNWMTGSPVKSRRTNNVATSYVSSMMNNYNKAQRNEAFGQSEDNILEFAKHNAAEQSPSNDYFLRAISHIRGVPSVAFFTWRDLLQLDPNVERDEVTEVTLMGSTMRVDNTDMHMVGRGADWGEASKYAQIATILGQGVPAIMMDLAFARISVSSTNRTIDGQMATYVEDYNSFPALCGAQVDFTAHVQAFIERIESMILFDLSFAGQADYAIRVLADLLGETQIFISFNGEPEEMYVMPSFADALLTPLVTANDNRAVQIAGDFQSLFSNTLGETNYGSDFNLNTNTGSASHAGNGNVFGSL